MFSGKEFLPGSKLGVEPGQFICSIWVFLNECEHLALNIVTNYAWLHCIQRSQALK
jgi:hypothetical protein